MRTLINYLRSCFCKHELELIGNIEIFQKESDTLPHTRRQTYMCKKCGYVKKISL